MVKSYETDDDRYHGQMRTMYKLDAPSDENTQYLSKEASIQIEVFLEGAFALHKINPHIEMKYIEDIQVSLKKWKRMSSFLPVRGL